MTGRQELLAAQSEQVAHLAAKYGSDLAHVRHVAVLAGALFDALTPLHGLAEPERTLLVHASQLHDTGLWLNPAGHHRHSAYIVRHDILLADYPLADRQLLARLVRNHRRRPRPAPKSWPLDRRLTLLWLSALLRTADGLDMRHDQAASLVAVQRKLHGLELVIGGVDASRFDRALAKKAALLGQLAGGPVRWRVASP